MLSGVPGLEVESSTAAKRDVSTPRCWCGLGPPSGYEDLEDLNAEGKMIVNSFRSSGSNQGVDLSIGTCRE
jgi:hypothetical protein